MSTNNNCNVGVCDDEVSTCKMVGKLQNIRLGNNSVSVCANCGKGEEESGNLKACTACKLVKYCNRECQIAHRPKHKKECRKRAAELHDENLFKQPPPQEEDCPICFLLLPSLDPTGKKYQTCCGKTICSGCIHANALMRTTAVALCPFCRMPSPTSDEVGNERERKRMEANDPIALYNLGCYYHDGKYGFTQDVEKAMELWHRSAELGHAASYSNIGYFYNNNSGVETDKKGTHYYELAAMMGNEVARHNLGCEERNAGNMKRALKHYMISVRGGYADSLKSIKELYSYGYATKENYTTALRLYQEYLGEIKSPQRDEAAAFHEKYRYY